MGLSVAIAGAIVLSVIMLVMMTLTGFVGTIFTIGEVTTKVSEHDKAISETEISMNHVSTVLLSPTLNFTLSNDGQEKLWNFDEFDLFVIYDGDVSGRLTEEISYDGDCLGGIPAKGKWCIESINGDLLDPGILNSAEGANIRVQVNENLAVVDAIVSITTDNGVTDTVMAPYCGPRCYQMTWGVNYGDDGSLDWTNIGGAGGTFEELDNNNNYRNKLDLTDMSEWRFVLFTQAPNGGPGCFMGVQYSPDNSDPWRALDNGVTDAISTAASSCSATNTYTVTAWSPINTTAQSDVWLRVGAVGDNSADPDFGSIHVQFRG